MNFTWAITSIDTIKSENSLSDIVYNVGWKLTGTKSGFSTIKTDTCWHLASPNSESFTAYNSLSEATVIGWVKSHLGSTEVTAIETEVTNMVDALIASNNETNKSLPW